MENKSDSSRESTSSPEQSEEKLLSETELWTVTDNQPSSIKEDHECEEIDIEHGTCCGSRDPHSRRMKRIGLAQTIVASICISIAIPLTVEFHRASAGSGIWCPVFFFLMGGLNYTSASKQRPFVVMMWFGITCTYFALLMLAVEAIELKSLLVEKYMLLAVCLHFVLCAMSGTEVMLTIAGIWFCRQASLDPKEEKTKTLEELPSSKKTAIVEVILGEA
ncbi:unnamed protein product [Clavelina lepadiformis]|uniref:Uncharacterized protein n=1 Tax=Clavelina lepadiformis TaxID=159417 RepID=A0ABP0G3R0_CLALP